MFYSLSSSSLLNAIFSVFILILQDILIISLVLIYLLYDVNFSSKLNTFSLYGSGLRNERIFAATNLSIVCRHPKAILGSAFSAAVVTFISAGNSVNVVRVT